MTEADGPSIASLRSKLARPVPIQSLAAFRILFGLLMAAGTIRFVASGWIEELFIRPSFFFKYPGFEWMPVWSPTGLYIHFSIVTIAALFIALGLFYRVSTTIFLLGFAGIQLFDAANYLNHYYLVICMGCVLLCLPAGRYWSSDVWRKPSRRMVTFPAWGLYLLRFQVALVYIFAAIAKLDPDWLIHAQPLSIGFQPGRICQFLELCSPTPSPHMS